MMKSVNDCPECESTDIIDGRLVGHMDRASRFSKCNECGCEWVLHVKPDMLTVTMTFVKGEWRKHITEDRPTAHRARAVRGSDRRMHEDGHSSLGRRITGERRNTSPAQ